MKILLTAAMCLLVISCTLPKSQTRGSLIVQDCEYAILDSSDPAYMCLKANELNKIFKDACDDKWDQIRSTQ